MWRLWTIAALASAAAFGAEDRFGNTNDPLELPCTFADGVKSCSVEFSIVGFKTTKPDRQNVLELVAMQPCPGSAQPLFRLA